jgi:hypothetical protein
MNDWWNDPPEQPEAPECPACGEGVGEVVTLYAADTSDGDCFQCDVCGHRWPLPAEQDPEPEDFFTDADFKQSFTVPVPSKCPHGEEWGECGACDHEGDLAYDAARERRIFGR